MTPPAKYRVDLPQTVLDQFRILALRAIRKGLLSSFIAAVREMNLNLERRPAAWGDPMFLYPVLGWLQYQRAVGPLYLCYCVDEAHQTVYVKLVLPFPSRGLESVP
jgi:hypothetical protein